MKMPNGFGTVYKLSGSRRKPWIARITTGWDENGKQLFQTIGYFEEKNEAIDALTKHRINPVAPRANITFEELYKEWALSKYEYIARQTIDNYKAGWKHLSKYKNVKFKELRTSHLQSVVDSCHREGLGRSSLSKIKLVASMLYDYAMQNDMATKNYAEFLRMPKQIKEEKKAFNDLEVRKIDAAVASVEWADTIQILIYTGLRISELLNLTKFSVNFEEMTITGGLKTDAGRDRVIPIHPKILSSIKKWYDKNGTRLICNDKGKAISSRIYREDLYLPALKAIGVRELNPHSCRHTCASLLAKAGADHIYIQKILGHTDYALTANTYTHTDIDELRKAINMI